MGRDGIRCCEGSGLGWETRSGDHEVGMGWDGRGGEGMGWDGIGSNSAHVVFWTMSQGVPLCELKSAITSPVGHPLAIVAISTELQGQICFQNVDVGASSTHTLKAHSSLKVLVAVSS